MDTNEIPICELEEYGLPSRVIDLLDNENIIYIGQALRYNRDQMLSLPNMGLIQLRQLLKALVLHRMDHNW